ncbi:ankyrin repeat family protein [Orientia chuto str. Dubai]|uniref:Ankyrin repeat family protein n=1 Tax=Orientia chuto str. Dubai TaxID=1359168 RepID=A0A0F3MKL2_9RICK|nr:ankyrin repeat domain-containing protein [Candidatus Orientia mediorientalis]KJV56176.1 ankyrin repeat family protein [Orientia chuto str. Dubai]
MPLDSDSNTALHLAAKYQKTEIVNLLLSYNANVALKNNHEDTPLHFAVNNKDAEVVEQMLQNHTSSAAINSQNTYGLTPLHLICKRPVVGSDKDLTGLMNTAQIKIG